MFALFLADVLCPTILTTRKERLTARPRLITVVLSYNNPSVPIMNRPLEPSLSSSASSNEPTSCWTHRRHVMQYCHQIIAIQLRTSNFEPPRHSPSTYSTVQYSTTTTRSTSYSVERVKYSRVQVCANRD